MKLEFKRLIKEFSQDFILQRESNGQLVGGRWEEGTKEVLLCSGVIRNVSDEEVKLYEGGKYTTNDIKIRIAENMTATVLEKVDENQYQIPENPATKNVIPEKDEIVFHDGMRYKVDNLDDRDKIGDYYNYIATKESVSEEVVEIV